MSYHFLRRNSQMQAPEFPHDWHNLTRFLGRTLDQGYLDGGRTNWTSQVHPRQRLTIQMLDSLPPKAGVVDLLPSRKKQKLRHGRGTSSSLHFVCVYKIHLWIDPQRRQYLWRYLLKACIVSTRYAGCLEVTEGETISVSSAIAWTSLADHGRPV